MYMYVHVYVHICIYMFIHKMRGGPHPGAVDDVLGLGEQAIESLFHIWESKLSNWIPISRRADN